MTTSGVLSKGRDVIRSLSKIASQRTIQLKVEPAPVKLSERRAVLNALQQLVKVEVFRKLNPDNSFMSVLKTKDDVQHLLERSPLEFSLLTQQPSNGVLSFLTSAPSTNAIIDANAAEERASPQGPNNTRKAPGPTDRRRFTVHIFPMREYVHASAIRSSPLHGPWPQRGKVELERVLKSSLPDNIAARGLSDWETGGQVPDVTKTTRLEDILFGHVAMDVGKRAVQERKKRAEMKRNRPAVMDGLLHIRRKDTADTTEGTVNRDTSEGPAT